MHMYVIQVYEEGVRHPGARATGWELPNMGAGNRNMFSERAISPAPHWYFVNTGFECLDVYLASTNISLLCMYSAKSYIQ